MPGKIKVRVLGARHLPVMDRASELTDAFVEIKFGNQTQKTEVIRKSLNPQWNSEWFRFEVDDEELQDEPLQIRVMDHDTYSAHDAIGKVYLDLNPLLCQREEAASTNASTSGVVLSGWLPIFDTMHGIRGDINVIVKVDLFSDLNRYRHSSCGVHFFSTPGVPRGYLAETVFGFVEELVVNDDPEYKWIDKIRTPRASNEARQRLFSTMSGEVQRRIGLKVQEMGGNAAIGYQQSFDLEGESGIVVRGIATAVLVTKLAQPSQVALPSPHSLSPTASPQPEGEPNFGSPQPKAVSPLMPRKSGIASGTAAGRRKSSDSDTDLAPSSTSKRKDRGTGSNAAHLATGTGLSSSSANPEHGKGHARVTGMMDREPSGSTKLHPTSKGMPFHRPVQKPIDFLDYPFFTITSFPPGYLVHIGGVVSARSVKLLDRILHPEEPETRDAWWAEIRTEIRSHCRAMGCHAVVGYSESTSISDDVCILSAIGTAARINVVALQQPPYQSHGIQMNENLRSARPNVAPSASHGCPKKDSGGESVSGGGGVEKSKNSKSLHVDVQLANQFSIRQTRGESDPDDVPISADCSLCHVPYDETNVPFPAQLASCSICHQAKVPGVLFSTTEPPPTLPVIGKGCLIQARVCRNKKEWRGELNAKDISDTLPFLEYELHHQLINKLKINGMNALFGLRARVHVGYNVLVAVATATAVKVPCLPSPSVPRLVCKTSSSVGEERKLSRLQERMTEIARRNASVHGVLDEGARTDQETDDDNNDIDNVEAGEPNIQRRTDSSVSNPDMCPNEGGKEAYVIEVDDPEDVEAINLMLDDVLPSEGIEVCNTEFLPGASPPSGYFNFPPVSIFETSVGSQAANQMFASIVRKNIGQNGLTHKQFGEIFSNILDRLYYKLRNYRPCIFSKLLFDISVEESEFLQISLTGMCTVVGSSELGQTREQKSRNNSGGEGTQFKMDGFPTEGREARRSLTTRSGQKENDDNEESLDLKDMAEVLTKIKTSHHGKVEVTPMSTIPGFQVTNYLGNMNLFVIRETSSVREFGGISGFMHKFVSEVLALMRAHVAALGGNALLAFAMNQCVLLDNPNRNQAQCLINITGDAASVESERDLAAAAAAALRRRGSLAPKNAAQGIGARGAALAPQSLQGSLTGNRGAGAGIVNGVVDGRVEKRSTLPVADRPLLPLSNPWDDSEGTNRRGIPKDLDLPLLNALA